MLACDKTVTLVRCDGVQYETTVIEGVSWFDKEEVIVSNTGLTPRRVTVVRIPAAVAPEMLPKAGDTMLLGAAPVITCPADLKQYPCFLVTSVGDNRRGRLPHVVVRGHDR